MTNNDRKHRNQLACGSLGAFLLSALVAAHVGNANTFWNLWLGVTSVGLGVACVVLLITSFAYHLELGD